MQLKQLPWAFFRDPGCGVATGPGDNRLDSFASFLLQYPKLSPNRDEFLGHFSAPVASLRFFWFPYRPGASDCKLCALRASVVLFEAPPTSGPQVCALRFPSFSPFPSCEFGFNRLPDFCFLFFAFCFSVDTSLFLLTLPNQGPRV